MSGVAGMRVLVTGGASGIGAACAAAFGAAGARVAVLDRTPAPDRPHPGAVQTVALTADVTDPDAVATAVAAAADRLGGLDAVVCCAGVSGPVGTPLAEVTPAEWTAVLAVNVTGPFLVVKYALGHLRRSDRAVVVFLGSDSGFVAVPGMVPYCTSKGALVQLTRALAVELADDAVRVCSVCPSIVDTPMSRADLGAAFPTTGTDVPVQRPEQVAAQVLHLADPASSALSGVNLVADFGFSGRSSFPA